MQVKKSTTEIEKPDYAKKEEKSKKEETAELSLHKDLPNFKDFCILMCDNELSRLEQGRKQIKRMKKNLGKIQSSFKAVKSDNELTKLDKLYPDFRKAYDDVNKELHNQDAERNDEKGDVSGKTVKSKIDAAIPGDNV